MRAVRAALRSAVGVTLLVAVALSGCLWFLGGHLGIGEARPFETPVGRVLGLGALWLAALLVILGLLLRDRRRDRRLVEDVVADPEPQGEATAEELGEMRAKLWAAMTRLRRGEGGRRKLLELPWYVVIGPPGAGKTTAILNAGLSFPLDEEPVGGVGGTRNCDWWFSEEAVLVDTAGRYTTQESDARADQAAWLGFLDILKRHRRRQLINGAVVAIGLSDLSMQDEATRRGHAAAVRRRLGELRERLGVRFPVYVLFTKADLLAGFAEFFEPLGRREREQVWGFTLPLGERDPGAVEAEWDALVERLHAQSVARLEAEADPQRRGLIAGLPSQLASVKPVARDFLGALFGESRFDEAHMLRGVYLTSGTQEGTPIDRLMTGMARAFGIGRQAVGTGRGTGRSFFLTGLFRDVMVPEAGLVSADDRVERRYRRTKRAAVAATLVVALAMGALWTRSFLGNRALAAGASERVALFREAEAAIPGSPVGDTDLPGVVPALNLLRDLPGNPAAGAAPVPEALRWGLYQGDVVGTRAQQAHRAALGRHLLPRLLLRLEEQMEGAINEPDFLHEALRVYLMLGLVGPMDAGAVADWMRLDWQAAFPGPGREALRADLEGHLAAMLAQPMRRVELNADLVGRVRAVLAEMPRARRAYASIVDGEAAAALPPWRPTDHGGPNLARAMTRASGAPLADGVPGLFTAAGFHELFLGEVAAMAERVAADAWILGEDPEAALDEAALDQLRRDVSSLYYEEYSARWEALLADLSVVPFEGPSHAAEVTGVLSGPASPISGLLGAAARETRLTELPPEEGVELPEGAERAATRLVPGPAGRALRAGLAAGGGGGGGEPPGAYVEERFERLHRLVAAEEGRPSELDAFVEGPLRELRAELADVAAGRGGGEAVARFRQAAEAQPAPLGRWARQIAEGSSGVAAGSTRAGIDARWQSAVLPLCRRATEGAYPFDRRAEAAIGLQDFARLFAPDGLIDAFFREMLAEHVDMSGDPWTLRPDSDLGLAPTALGQMQHAASIRDAFFAGGDRPEVTFQVNLFAFDDASAERVELRIDRQLLRYRRGAVPQPGTVTWPGATGVAQLELLPHRAGSRNVLRREGAWAWFRLLDAAALRPGGSPRRVRAIFGVGGRPAVFDIETSSVANPFALPALEAFDCPETF